MTSAVVRKEETVVSFSEDELIMLAHLRMRRFSTQSALLKMRRVEVTIRQVDTFIRKHFGNWDGFFGEMKDKVHEARRNRLLPEVKTPTRKPRNELFFFGQR